MLAIKKKALCRDFFREKVIAKVIGRKKNRKNGELNVIKN